MQRTDKIKLPTAQTDMYPYSKLTHGQTLTQLGGGLDDKDQRLFATELEDCTLKIGLLSNKAVAIAKLLRDMLQRNLSDRKDQDHEACPGCSNKFIIFYRKRHICSSCALPYCQSCLKYTLLIDTERLVQDVEEKVNKIMDPSGKLVKKDKISFPICGECFNQICLEITQLERTGHHQQQIHQRKLKKLESLFESPQHATKQPVPSKYSQMAKRSMLTNFKARKSSASFNDVHGGDLFSPGLQPVSDSAFMEAVKENDLHHIVGLRELFTDIEDMNLSRSILEGILEHFIMKLLDLEWDESLPYSLALEQLVKIYSVSNYASQFTEVVGLEEVSHFHEGEIRSLNGTLVQKILRFKSYSETASVNNILLLSLPITSPYKILDKENVGGAETIDREDLNLDLLKEPNLLPQAPHLRDSNVLGTNDMVVSEMDGKDTKELVTGIGKDSTMSATVLMNSKMQEKSKVKFPENLYITLESLTFLKTQFSNYIKDHVAKNQIELIFSSEAIPSSLFEELKRQGVYVIFPVSIQELKLLSLVLKAKIINDVSVLTKDLGQEYLGNIKNYYLVNLLDQSQNYITSLICLDRLEPVGQEIYSSLGIIIYWQDRVKSLALKKFLRENLVYIYFNLMEHEFIQREKESTSKALYSDIPINKAQVGDFKRPLSASVEELRQHIKKHPKVFEYTEVELESLNSDNAYPDIDSEFNSIIERLFTRMVTLEGLKNVHDIQNRAHKSIRDPVENENFNFFFNTDLDYLASLNTTKNDSLMMIMSTPRYCACSPYSDQDQTLSIFLRTRVKYYEDIMKDDKLEWNNYQSLFYVADSCVKFRIQPLTKELSRNRFLKRVGGLGRTEQYDLGLYVYNMYTEEVGDNSKPNTSIYKSMIQNNRQSIKKPKNSDRNMRAAATPYNASRIERRTDGPNNAPSLMKDRILEGKSGEYLSNSVGQNSAAHTNHIKSYIVCDICQKVLSETMTLDSIHKNISMSLFLYSFGLSKKAKESRNLHGLRDLMDNIEGLDENAAGESYCKHHTQARVFVLGQTALKFTRYDTIVYKLLHFRTRETLLGTNTQFSHLRKAYLSDKLQYEDKVAKEIGNYYIRQICFMTFIMRDVVLKGNKIVIQDRIRAREKYHQHIKLIKHFIGLCDIIGRLWFVMNNFGNIELDYKYNHLLRAILVSIQNYDAVLVEIYQLLIGELKPDKKSSIYPDIIIKLCKMCKEYTAFFNNTANPRARGTEVGFKDMAQVEAILNRITRQTQMSAMMGSALGNPYERSLFMSTHSITPVQGSILHQQSISPPHAPAHNLVSSTLHHPHHHPNHAHPHHHHHHHGHHGHNQSPGPHPPTHNTTTLPISSRGHLKRATSARRMSAEIDTETVEKSSTDKEDSTNAKDMLKGFQGGKTDIDSGLHEERHHIDYWKRINLSSVGGKKYLEYTSFDYQSKLYVLGHVMESDHYIKRVVDANQSLYHQIFEDIIKDNVDERQLMRILISFRQSYEQEGSFNEWKGLEFDLHFLDIHWNVDVKELVKFNTHPTLLNNIQEPTRVEGEELTKENNIYTRYHLDEPNKPPLPSLNAEPLVKGTIDKIYNYFCRPELHSNMKYMSELFKEPSKVKYSVTIHYPVQFEALRIALGYKRKDFNKTLLASHRWLSSGGQTNADFYKSDNGRFVAKCISSLEFENFQQNALHYFKYMFSTICSNKETFLSKILAMVEMKVGKEDKTILMVMEGITYGLHTNENMRIFDLKGSKMNRFRREKIRTKTSLDTNYLLERNGDPLFVQMPAGMDFFAILERDVNYLRDRDIVDYSLLLVIQKGDLKVKVGIIDYLRKYDFKKKIEFGLKKIKNFGQDPTIVNPSQYADRFLQFMKNCIVPKSAPPEEVIPHL